MAERTITLSGFSKAYAMTGWRIGYFAGPRGAHPGAGEINHAFAISTAAVSQHAALAALTGPQDCVEEMRPPTTSGGVPCAKDSTSIGIPYAEPQGAFYVYANVSSTGMGGHRVLRAAARARGG